MTRFGRIARLSLLLAILPLSGCFLALHNSAEEWQPGLGLRPAPGLFTAGSGTIHPVLGFTYHTFDGGSDQLFEVGAQFRRPIPGDRPLWIGGEFTLSRLRTSIDFNGASFSNNGWSATALGGMPFGDNEWGTNLFAGVGFSDYGGSGINLRFGLDLQPASLINSIRD